MLCLALLPKEIQMKIQGFLYFSDKVATKMIIINGIIKNYDMYLWREMERIFRLRMLDLYIRLNCFVLKNDNILEKVRPFIHDNYTVHKIYLKEYIQTIIKNVNIIEKQKIYKFIMNT